MNTITVKIDEQLTYKIDLKGEYEVKDFISTMDKHLLKLRKISETKFDKEPNDIEKSRKVFDKRIDALYKETCDYIMLLGADIDMKDSATMRTFTSIDKKKNKKLGLAWLAQYPNYLLVYLRKGDYKGVDTKGKIVYSVPGKKTFGEYPYMNIYNQDELGYLFNVIKYIYNN